MNVVYLFKNKKNKNLKHEDGLNQNIIISSTNIKKLISSFKEKKIKQDEMMIGL